MRITEAKILAMVGQEVGSRETVNFKILLKVLKSRSNGYQGPEELP